MKQIDRIFVADSASITAIWNREVLSSLGGDDLCADAFISTLDEIGYAEWFVVEQDIFLRIPERFAQASINQRVSRAFLAECGL